jgi:hypothetical protein
MLFNECQSVYEPRFSGVFPEQKAGSHSVAAAQLDALKHES